MSCPQAVALFATHAKVLQLQDTHAKLVFYPVIGFICEALLPTSKTRHLL